MWHSQHLSPLFGVQREISHPDSRRHLFSSTAGRGTKPLLPRALSVLIIATLTALDHEASEF